MTIRQVAAVAAFAALAAPNAAQACSCLPWQNPKHHIDSVDVIFEGVAKRIRDVSGTGGAELRTRFKVMLPRKGKIGKTVWVRHNVSSAACGFQFTENRPYKVFARRRPDGSLRTSLCLMMMWQTAESGWDAYLRILDHDG
jgi:hypothetical protein